MRWLKAALMMAAGLFGWLSRTLVEGWTGRSFAAEAAEEEQARASAEQAEASREEERAHRATLESLAMQTLEATLALQSPAQEAPVADAVAERQVRDEERRARADERKARDEARRHAARAFAERKAEITDQGYGHVPEIRSSTFERTADPEGVTLTLKVA